MLSMLQGGPARSHITIAEVPELCRTLLKLLKCLCLHCYCFRMPQALVIPRLTLIFVRTLRTVNFTLWHYDAAQRQTL